MTQTLNYQFFSIFPLNLGISFFIFFSIVFTGLLLSILMVSHIGRNIGKMIQTGGGARLRRGIDAALKNIQERIQGSRSPQGDNSNNQGTSNDSNNQGLVMTLIIKIQVVILLIKVQTIVQVTRAQVTAVIPLMRVLKGTLLKLRFILSVSSPYSIKFSYFSLMLLNLLGKNIPQDMEPLFNFTGSMLILTLAVFFSILRIILYFFSVYYLDKYNIYDRYPKYRKWIKRMEKIRAYSIYTEIIILFVIVFLMLFLCVFMLWVLLQ